jgi:hypothetical protein
MNRVILAWFDRLPPELRRKAALVLLELTIPGYWLSVWAIWLQLGGWTWFEQILNAISWGAITITCADVLCTTDVRVQENDQPEGAP